MIKWTLDNLESANYSWEANDRIFNWRGNNALNERKKLISLESRKDIRRSEFQKFCIIKANQLAAVKLARRL